MVEYSDNSLTFPDDLYHRHKRCNPSSYFDKEFFKGLLKNNDWNRLIPYLCDFTRTRDGASDIFKYFFIKGILSLHELNSIPENLFAFQEINNLKIPNNIKRIEMDSFPYTKVNFLTFDYNSNLKIESLSFDHSYIVDLVVPDGCTLKIEDNAFIDSTINNLRLPKGTEAFEEAFCGCRINNLTLPHATQDTLDRIFGKSIENTNITFT